MELPEAINHYEIQKIIGTGGSGQVFEVKNSQNNKNFALKLSLHSMSFEKELRITKSLSHISGIPKIHDSGRFKNRSYFVTELLGRSLSYNSSEKVFSLEFISKVAWQILNILEKVHETGVIHRDLKPNNCLLSLDKSQVFLIDFGISGTFQLKGVHKNLKLTNKLIGTPLFASINSHLFVTSSRRDDLESLCYSLTYLVLGKLPWKTLNSLKGLEKWNFILAQKQNFMNTPAAKLIPQELCELFKYARALNYDQRPNYQYLRDLFVKLSGCLKMDLKAGISERQRKPSCKKNRKLRNNLRKGSNKRRFNKTVKFFEGKDFEDKGNSTTLMSFETSACKSKKRCKERKNRSQSSIRKDRRLMVSSSQANIPNTNDDFQSEPNENFKISKPGSKSSDLSFKESHSLTPKSTLPEFKNRLLIFKDKAEKTLNKTEDGTSCIVF